MCSILTNESTFYIACKCDCGYRETGYQLPSSHDVTTISQPEVECW